MERTDRLDFSRLTPEERAELDWLLEEPQSFREYVTRVRPGYEWHEPHELIAEYLDRVARGVLRRLMIFLPPQEGKSELVSRLFPAYYLTCHPDRWVGLGSYSFSLARTFSRDARAYYREATEPNGDGSDAVERWQTSRKGGLWAVGRGGSATGNSAHLLVVDDPLKDQSEADSEVVREGLHRWYGSVLNMRLQPEEQGNAVVICHTRWHDADLSGHLLGLEARGEATERWTILHLPGVQDAPEAMPRYPASCTVVTDRRRPGEPLRGRYGRTGRRYEQIRQVSGERAYAALVQQRPAPDGGSIFRRDWWKRYDPVTLPPMEQIVLSVDATFKNTDGSDYVAAHVWGRIGATLYGLHRVNARLSFTATLDLCRDLMKQYGCALYIEDKANGPAIVSALQKELLGVVPVEPEGGKVARAYAAQPVVQGGQVYLPVGESWEPFIAQCAAFPQGAHDDEVDAFTQAVGVMRWSLRPPEGWRPTVSSEVYADPWDPKTGRPVRPTWLEQVEARRARGVDLPRTPRYGKLVDDGARIVPDLL